MAEVRSSWAGSPVGIGGGLRAAEWSGAGRLPIPGGFLLVKNDARFLYLALDLVLDRGRDVGTGDYFWLTFDRDSNHAITPRHDVQYTLYPDQPNRLGRQYYVSPARWTGLVSERSLASCRVGFGATPNQATPHRFWEIRIPLEDLEVNLSSMDVPTLRFGLRVASTNPRFAFDFPNNFYRDFSGLHLIILARGPSGYPAGTAGAVLGGVGLIPASTIDSLGYATTDPSYFVAVDEAAFAGTLNLIGNRATLQGLWGSGARKYEVLHSHAGGSFTRIRQSWSNYRWNGTTYVLEYFQPDGDDNYPLLDPAQDYSIDDLLLQWRSRDFAGGRHQFRVNFFTNAGAPVAAPSQTLTLEVDNNLPNVELIDVLHNGNPVSACAIEEIGPGEGLRFRITANDPEGNLRGISLTANYGAGQSTLIYGDNYSNHRQPNHQWNGVVDVQVPGADWVPPVTCAYQFRLAGTPRTTNGYGYTSAHSAATRHVTLIRTAAEAAAVGDVEERVLLPYGIGPDHGPEQEGHEPDKLGNETEV